MHDVSLQLTDGVQVQVILDFSATIKKPLSYYILKLSLCQIPAPLWWSCICNTIYWVYDAKTWRRSPGLWSTTTHYLKCCWRRRVLTFTTPWKFVQKMVHPQRWCHHLKFGANLDSVEIKAVASNGLATKNLWQWSTCFSVSLMCIFSTSPCVSHEKACSDSDKNALECGTKVHLVLTLSCLTLSCLSDLVFS